MGDGLGLAVIGPLGHELFPELVIAPLSPFGKGHGDALFHRLARRHGVAILG